MTKEEQIKEIEELKKDYDFIGNLLTAYEYLYEAGDNDPAALKFFEKHFTRLVRRFYGDVEVVLHNLKSPTQPDPEPEEEDD